MNTLTQTQWQSAEDSHVSQERISQSSRTIRNINKTDQLIILSFYWVSIMYLLSKKHAIRGWYIARV